MAKNTSDRKDHAGNIAIGVANKDIGQGTSCGKAAPMSLQETGSTERPKVSGNPRPGDAGVKCRESR